MENKKWQALVKDRREVFARERDQVLDASGIRRHNPGKAGGKESWQAVRQAAKTHCPEDREV